MYMLYIWLAIIVLGVIVELIDSGTLVSCWFSVGAVIPLCMSIYKTNNAWYISAQVIVFGLVTVLCIIFLRKIAMRLLFKNDEKTNLDVHIGKRLKVISVSEDATRATIKLNDVEYTAVGEDDEIFEVDKRVEVLRFKGNKVIVKKIIE